MNQDEKENMCHIIPYCADFYSCIHKSGDNVCKYLDEDQECTSSVARVNAMTLEIKRLTGEL